MIQSLKRTIADIIINTYLYPEKMKKSYLTAAAVLTASLWSAASAQTTMTVVTASGDSPEKTLTTASKLVFGNGFSTIDLLNGGKTEESYPLAGIVKINFKYDPRGVEAIAADGTLRLRENPVGGTIALTGEVPAEARLEVFSIAGARELFIPAWKGEDIDTSTLPAGLHILKINSQTLKFIKL